MRDEAPSDNHPFDSTIHRPMMAFHHRAEHCKDEEYRCKHKKNRKAILEGTDDVGHTSESDQRHQKIHGRIQSNSTKRSE